MDRPLGQQALRKGRPHGRRNRRALRSDGAAHGEHEAEAKGRCLKSSVTLAPRHLTNVFGVIGHLFQDRLDLPLQRRMIIAKLGKPLKDMKQCDIHRAGGFMS
jgi:hypothetical protein